LKPMYQWLLSGAPPAICWSVVDELVFEGDGGIPNGGGYLLQGGTAGKLAGYPAEEQDLIRRAWAAPPPSVDDEVAVELAERIRLDRMKSRLSAIIRELSEAERGRDSVRVTRLESEARELSHAIGDLERRMSSSRE